MLGYTTVAFDIWGDAVNCASRMESTSLPGVVQCTQSTWDCVQAYYTAEVHEVQVKGKGLMTAYRIIPPGYQPKPGHVTPLPLPAAACVKPVDPVPPPELIDHIELIDPMALVDPVMAVGPGKTAGFDWDNPVIEPVHVGTAQAGVAAHDRSGRLDDPPFERVGGLVVRRTQHRPVEGGMASPRYIKPKRAAEGGKARDVMLRDLDPSGPPAPADESPTKADGRTSSPEPWGGPGTSERPPAQRREESVTPGPRRGVGHEVGEATETAPGTKPKEGEPTKSILKKTSSYGMRLPASSPSRSHRGGSPPSARSSGPGGPGGPQSREGSAARRRGGHKGRRSPEREGPDRERPLDLQPPATDLDQDPRAPDSPTTWPASPAGSGFRPGPQPPRADAGPWSRARSEEPGEAPGRHRSPSPVRRHDTAPAGGMGRSPEQPRWQDLPRLQDVSDEE